MEPVLNDTAHWILQKSKNRPIIRWCPTGLFAFLPIHAAGCYLDGVTEDRASEYIISTYTPTVEQLLPKNGSKTANTHLKVLVIAHNNLYFVGKELELIQKIVPKLNTVTLGIPNSNNPARAKDVVTNLSAASIVHFACHGEQHQDAPLRSALLVGEERQNRTITQEKITIEEIMKYPLPNGSLAVLCACETAMGDEKLPDEAMSIGGALIFAGFHSVVATMW